MSEAREEQPSAAEESRRAPPTLANGAGDTADDEVAAEVREPAWREDWRTALAGGDEKKAKQLERFSTPEAVARALFDTRERMARTRAMPEPPEEATELELAKWRKEVGIPETPEGYGVELAADASDSQKAELAEYLKFAHDKGLAPKAVKESVSWFNEFRAAAAERAEQAAEDATLENLAELRKSYPGREYKRNIGLANDFLNDRFAGPNAQAALDTILAAKLPNGVQLTNYAPFVQFIATIARAAASEDDLVAGDIGGGARSVDEEWKELANKPRLSTEERNRMLQLAEARLKRQERAGAR